MQSLNSRIDDKELEEIFLRMGGYTQFAKTFGYLQFARELLRLADLKQEGDTRSHSDVWAIYDDEDGYTCQHRVTEEVWKNFPPDNVTEPGVTVDDLVLLLQAVQRRGWGHFRLFDKENGRYYPTGYTHIDVEQQRVIPSTFPILKEGDRLEESMPQINLDEEQHHG
jgi:hypothetical protein